MYTDERVGLLGLMRKVVYFSLPIVFLQMLSVAAGFVDAAFLAHLGAATLAADGLAYRAYMVVLIFSSGISLALGVRLARVVDEATAFRAMLLQSFYLVLLLAILGVFFLAVLAPFLFRITGQPIAAVALAKPYLIQLALAQAAMFFAGLLRQVLIVLGRGVWLYALAVLYLVSHIMISYGFIFGHWGFPQWGLVGVGISEWVSVLLTVIACVFLLLPWWRSRRPHPASSAGCRLPSLSSFLSLWGFSWPVAGLMTFEMLAFMMMVIMLGHFGVQAIASYVMASQLDILPLMIPYGFEIALGILVSKTLAKGDRDTIGSLVRTAMWLVMVPMVVISFCFWLYPAEIIRFVFHARLLSNPRLLHLTVHMLMIAGVYHLFYGLRNVWVGVLRGLGDVRVPMLIVTGCFWIGGLGSAYGLAQTQLGALGVWLGMAAAMILAALGVGWRYRVIVAKVLTAEHGSSA